MIVETVEGNSVCEVWEEALIRTKRYGIKQCWENDQTAYWTVPMVMEIAGEPDLQRLYHRQVNFLPGDLVTYIDEVVKGIKNTWVDLDSPTKWHYTYNGRLTAYPIRRTVKVGIGTKQVDVTVDATMDQVAVMLDHVRRSPGTRRAQAITWIPGIDAYDDDPPCLQRLWLQVVNGRLDMHTHWRSREASLAAYMNMMALTEWHRVMAEQLGVPVGYYRDFTDSYHIYERDLPSVTRLLTLFNKFPSSHRWMTQQQFDEALDAQKG